MDDRFDLLLDSGNSRLKWAILSRAGIAPGPPVVTGGRINAAELERVFGGLPTPARVWIANVAGPAAERELRTFIRSRWRMEPGFVRSQAVGFGVKNGYRQPEALGVDRWLALVAVRNRYDLPALIADCGTALTLDVMDESGRHLGGVICPGLKLMAEALVQKTAGIRLEDRCGQAEVLGDHTAAAVHLGTRQAALGLIERVFFQQQNVYPTLSLILTGGDAAELSPGLQVPARLAPDLILEGLAVVGRW